MDMTTMTPEALRAEAQRCREQAEESFQRSDTDGFLSQWALGLSAQKADAQAKIAEAGGKAVFTGLYQGDRRVKAKLISQPAFNAPWVFEDVWLLDKSETDLIASRGKRYIPTAPYGAGKVSRVQKALGLSERQEWAPAKADIVGRGTGLSGTAWVETVRAGDEWGGDATPYTGKETQ